MDRAPVYGTGGPRAFFGGDCGPAVANTPKNPSCLSSWGAQQQFCPGLPMNSWGPLRSFLQESTRCPLLFKR
eukprot:1134270-Pelagomonas_calceolata.AAC.1